MCRLYGNEWQDVCDWMLQEVQEAGVLTSTSLLSERCSFVVSIQSLQVKLCQISEKMFIIQNVLWKLQFLFDAFFNLAYFNEIKYSFMNFCEIRDVMDKYKPK